MTNRLHRALLTLYFFAFCVVEEIYLVVKCDLNFINTVRPLLSAVFEAKTYYAQLIRNTVRPLLSADLVYPRFLRPKFSTPE